MPGTMRPFGMRARPPLWAARAAATWAALVNDTRKVSLATPNVTTAPDDGAVDVLLPHALASSVTRIAPAMNVGSSFLYISPLSAPPDERHCQRHERPQSRA